MTQWPQLLLVTFVGSSLGGLCRYLICSAVEDKFPSRFPLGTLIVNISGCFLIGLLAALALAPGHSFPLHAQQLLMAGFLGGYTTVSSFSLQTLHLAIERKWQLAGINVAASYFLCMLAVVSGYFLPNAFPLIAALFSRS